MEDERKPGPTLIIYEDGREELWFKGKKWDPSLKAATKNLHVVDLRKVAQARIDDGNEAVDDRS